jgi:2-amino-4-hydroxy-6-hydroxymethyldihydropteridine diphosphokinase
MPTAYIGIGSNLNPDENVMKALELLSLKAGITGISTFYRTRPVDRVDQPEFYNGVVSIETDNAPRDLKYLVLRNIEKVLGRIRCGDKSAPRTIDMDLLLFGAMVISEVDLVIPDPDIATRGFIAVPLCELSPGLVIPGSNLVIREVAARFKEHDMGPLPEYTDKLRRMLAYGHEQGRASGSGTAR